MQETIQNIKQIIPKLFKTMNKIDRQRERRKQNGDIDTKKYIKTPKGFLVNYWRKIRPKNETLRKKGILDEILSKEQYYNFSLNDDQYYTLLESWRINDYKEKLTPVLDRIDKTRGYINGNLQWVTNSEHSKYFNVESIDRKQTLETIFKRLSKLTEPLDWLQGREYFYTFKIVHRNTPVKHCYKFRTDEKQTRIWDISLFPYRPVTTDGEISFISNILQKTKVTERN